VWEKGYAEETITTRNTWKQQENRGRERVRKRERETKTG
jgi:hypothetical protein